MPKFNWDAFFGGAAEKGLEGYKIAGTLSAANRELQDRQMRTAIELGKNMPIEPYLEDAQSYRVPGIGGLATQQLPQAAGVEPATLAEADGSMGTPPTGVPSTTPPTQPAPGFGTPPDVRANYRIAQTGHFQRLYESLPEDARKAAESVAKGRIEEQHRKDLADDLTDFNERLRVYDGAARQIESYRNQRTGIETVLAGIAELQGPLYDLERRGLPVPDTMTNQLRAIGIPVQPGMTASQIAGTIDQYRDVYDKQKRDIDVELGKYASGVQSVQNEIRRLGKSLGARYDIPDELLEDYINGTSDVRRVLNNQIFRFGAGRMRKGTRGAPSSGYSLPRAK